MYQVPSLALWAIFFLLLVAVAGEILLAISFFRYGRPIYKAIGQGHAFRDAVREAGEARAAALEAHDDCRRVAGAMGQRVAQLERRVTAYTTPEQLDRGA